MSSVPSLHNLKAKATSPPADQRPVSEFCTSGDAGSTGPHAGDPSMGSTGTIGAMMQKVLARHSRPVKLDNPALPMQFEGCQPGDPMDQVMIVHLLSVGQETLPQLKVRKLGSGKYDIDGRVVNLRWKTPPGSGASVPVKGDTLELLAREQDTDGGRVLGEEIPLATYLSSAANVLVSLRGRSPGAPAVARLPKEKRLTFGGCSTASSALESMDVLQRCESMRKACEEAQLREWAAEAYEHGVPWPMVPPPPTLMTAAARQQTLNRNRKQSPTRPVQRPPPQVSPPTAQRPKHRSVGSVEPWLESL